MKSKKVFASTIIFLLMFSLFFLFSLGGSKDLIASLAQLPGLADSPERGLFVDLVKAIDEVYTDGTIKIEVYPFARSIDNVLRGKADFHIPINKEAIPVGAKAVTEKIGTASFVICSHKDKPITKKMIEDAIVKGGEFPYTIEGGEFDFGFPVIHSFSVEQSLKKVNAKRLDAYIFPQEDVDFFIKNLKLKNIHREHWRDCDDNILINAKGAEADKLDKILSDALKKLKASGRLQKLYSKIHRPYNNWQPAEMGW